MLYLLAFATMQKQASPQYPLTIPARTHTIVKGDSFDSLKNKYNITMDAIRKANPKVNPGKLMPGKTLAIPSVTYKEPFRPIPKRVFNGIAMQESFNGKFPRGDRDPVTGEYRSKGILHYLKESPENRAKYLRGRKGKHTTYYRVVDSVNDTYGTKYTEADLDDNVKQLRIAKLYLTNYAKDYYRRNGGVNPPEDVLWRMWNGGPDWHTKPATIRYAADVKRKLRNPAKWGLTPGVFYNKTK